MRPARPAARAKRADRVIPTGPRDPSAADVSAAPAAEGDASRRGAVWPIAVSVVWLALALRSPHVTYHLAPFLAAASWPVALRLRGRAPVPAHRASTVAAGGLGLTLVAAFVLAVGRALGGPSVWHGSGALETPVVAVVGAAWGWRAATRHRLGLLG